MVPALTSRALLAKRQMNATGLGGTPVLHGMLRPVSSAPTRGLQRADAARHHRVLLRRLALCAVDGLDGSGGKFREGKWGAGLAGFEMSLKFRYAGSVAGLGDWEGAVVAELRFGGVGEWVVDSDRNWGGRNVWVFQKRKKGHRIGAPSHNNQTKV